MILTTDPAVGTRVHARGVSPGARGALWAAGLALAAAFGAACPAHAASKGEPKLELMGPRGRCNIQRPKGGLLILCGAGLRTPMEALRKEFERRHHIPLRVAYSGSQCLLAQIAITHRNRLVDVYMPGEEFFAKQARDRGFVAEYRPISYFVPVIMVRGGNPKGIRSLKDLAKPGIRVGLGEPRTCAIGKTTQDLLAKHGLVRSVMKNVVMHTAMAPELGNAVKLGSIDAAINWDAVSVPYEDGTDIVTIPPKDNIPVRASVSILKGTRAPQQARLFYQFAAGKEGQAIFRTCRYTVDLKHPVYAHRGG